MRSRKRSLVRIGTGLAAVLAAVFLCVIALRSGWLGRRAEAQNDRALDDLFHPVMEADLLPDTALVYHTNDLSSAFNGGGCVYEVRYLFETGLPEAEFMAAYENTLLNYIPSWVDQDRFETDEDYRATFHPEEVSRLNDIFAAGRHAARLHRVDTITFGNLRNGLDPRCGNFD
jgi:hypothetical protein